MKKGFYRLRTKDSISTTKEVHTAVCFIAHNWLILGTSVQSRWQPIQIYNLAKLENKTKK